MSLQKSKHTENIVSPVLGVNSFIPIREITRLDDILCSDAPLFVDFYAPWCPHCKHLRVELDELVQRVGQSVRILSVNCCNNNSIEIKTKYDIKYYPTLLYFRKSALDRPIEYIGERKCSAMLKWLNQNLYKEKKSK